MKQLWASGECNGLAHHRSWVQDPVGMVLSTELPTGSCLLVSAEGRGRISRSGQTQDIKMGSCVFKCDVPHHWTSQ